MTQVHRTRELNPLYNLDDRTGNKTPDFFLPLLIKDYCHVEHTWASKVHNSVEVENT